MDPQSIRIWQQNARKLLTTQLATLHSVEDEYDIICIQELHIDFQAMSRATSVWTTVYPSGFKHDKNGPPARALTLVRTRILTNNWTQTPIDSPDVVAIRLTCARGTLHVYNIYNDCTHSDTVHALSRPPSTPTITNSRGGQTRPDNIFITRNIENWITVCEVRPDDTPPLADHFPIVTHVDFPVPRPTTNRPWNFQGPTGSTFAGGWQRS